MKAIRIHQFGKAKYLEVNEIPVPIPGEGEMLIKISAAGVNPVDTKIRAGEFSRFVPELPAVIGRDVSGTIERISGVVAGFEPGAEVFGFEKEVTDLDLVIDLIGGETRKRSWQILRKGGSSHLHYPAPNPKVART